MKDIHSSTLTPTNLSKNYYSKQLGQFDCELTFDKTLKNFMRLQKRTQVFNNKELKSIFYQKEKLNEDEFKKFKKIKSKINEIKLKPKFRSFSPLNEIAKHKRISYLPQISPFILSNKSSILIDYNKALETGSEGFKLFCDNENQNIKDILYAYNDHDFKSYKDYNSFFYFNKLNENYYDTNITNIVSQTETEKNNKLNTNVSKIIEENNNIHIKDIFDKKFIKNNRISKIKKILLKKNERIKDRNNKVFQLIEQIKQSYIKKKKDNLRYKINYNSIEKHIPFTILYSKSQRCSPENMIHTHFNFNYQKNNNNDIILDKQIKPIKPIKIKKHIKPVKKENKNDKFFTTNKIINLCSGKYDFDL